ncbi:class I SAM-dependent methyltransferase [Pseudodonghicola flavimaris]|uniref:Class I SAM-dependent methyltransferase n=1 Tax=Pseudodonghicola flavimaris TaxID=3050036 RepID=A0ABT7EVS0_9RHOB|nr:class I SAM-dependent methyltransferase [Pseudodonghicola flavimaris]MDK3016413.1 class I SAM-dependent methyltransferase [Pseudodonghicola flavimaris]
MPKPQPPEIGPLIDRLDPARRRRLARSLAEAETEQARLRAFEAAGGLDRPAYALSPGMAEVDLAPMIAGARTHAAALAGLMDAAGSESGYRAGNGYFDRPDAEALYLMIRRFAPTRVVEVGCGHSTRITRQAIRDGGLETELLAIDPWPRADIADAVDRFEQSPVETADPEIFAALGAGDVLFIDSSHQLRIGNDVAHLFCRILPALAPGVVIHVHDVFLPYEYPKRFFYDCPSWGEQYMLHGVLQGGGYEILWPGYYLQQADAAAVAALPFLAEGRAQSFWMRKR